MRREGLEVGMENQALGLRPLGLVTVCEHDAIPHVFVAY